MHAKPDNCGPGGSHGSGLTDDHNNKALSTAEILVLAFRVLLYAARDKGLWRLTINMTEEAKMDRRTMQSMVPWLWRGRSGWRIHLKDLADDGEAIQSQLSLFSSGPLECSAGVSLD